MARTRVERGVVVPGPPARLRRFWPDEWVDPGEALTSDPTALALGSWNHPDRVRLAIAQDRWLAARRRWASDHGLPVRDVTRDPAGPVATPR